MVVLMVCSVIIVIATATYALTGFGFGLVAVPLLAVATDPRTAVAVAAIDTVALAIVVAVRDRHHVRWVTGATTFVGALVGMPLGLAVLIISPERVLTALIALALLGCTVLIWRGFRVRSTTATVATAGVISGILATSTGTSGPPVVVTYQAMGYDPATFRATLSMVFTATGLCAIGAFAASGQLPTSAVTIGLVGVPAMFVGWWCGNALFQRLASDRFRQLVLAVLAITAMVTLVFAVLG